MISQANNAIKSGTPVIIYDDGSQTPCSYLIIPAVSITEDITSFFLNVGKGNILCAIREEHAKKIGLSSLTSNTSLPYQMTIGVEAREGVGSGISAKDRTHTIKAILNSTDHSRLIVGPGHIYPITAHKDGLLVRSGIAEASCDLLAISGLPEVAAVTHCLNDDGAFLSQDELQKLAKDKKLEIIKTSNIIHHRLIHEKLVRKVSEAMLPTERFGTLKVECFISAHDNAEHLVLTKGEIKTDEAVLTRMHSEKKLADIFSLANHGERDKINSSLDYISNSASGILVYIKKNSKNSLTSVIDSEQSSSNNSIRELRELGIGAHILRELGISKIKLLTTQKKVLNNLEAYGIKIEEQILIKSNS